MNTRSAPGAKSLDERLSAAFAGIDASPDFDVRLMARIATESQTDAILQASRARRLEQERYSVARRELLSWGHKLRSLLRLATLDVLGTAALVVIAALAAWSELAPLLGREIGPQLMGELRQNAMIMLPSVLGILIGLIPLAGIMVKQHRARLQYP